jgi:uncharacterized protein
MGTAIVNDKMKLMGLIAENSDVIRQYGVKAIGLFGSFVRNEQNDQSDIDLLVEFEHGKKTYNNFIKLAYYLEDLFGRKVELLTSQSISPYIRPHIMKEVEYVAIAS